MRLNVYKRHVLDTPRDSPQEALQDAQRAAIQIVEYCPHCGGEVTKTCSYVNRVSTGGGPSGPVGMIELQHHNKDECISYLRDKIDSLEKKLALLLNE